jgi:NitT/TauT family transport system ATP-binding protein
VRATHEVSFDVYRGDRFVLLGPSGCGKSTLLKAVGGFIAPASGGLLLAAGASSAGAGPHRRVPGIRPAAALEDGEAERDVSRCWPAAFRKEAEARALHWLDKVGLARFADAYPHTLSGGMKARVAIARALAMQPDILLMDEPFAALDALTRRRMQEELQALWEEVGFTMLFVTHSIEEALVVGNRILLLSPHPGRVRAEINSHQFGLPAAAARNSRPRRSAFTACCSARSRKARGGTRRPRRHWRCTHERAYRSAGASRVRAAAARRPAGPAAAAIHARRAPRLLGRPAGCARPAAAGAGGAVGRAARWPATTCCCRASCRPRGPWRGHRVGRAAALCRRVAGVLLQGYLAGVPAPSC